VIQRSSLNPNGKNNALNRHDALRQALSVHLRSVIGREGGKSSEAALLHIRCSWTLVRPIRLISLGSEFGGLLDQARSHIRVRDCPGEFEKCRCLTCQILPAHHCCCLRIATPQALRCNAGIVPAAVLRSAHLIFVPFFRISGLRHFGFPFARGTNIGCSRFFLMRIREENGDMVLLAGVTLVSAVIAGGAALLEPASAVSKSRPIYYAAAASSVSERKPARLVDPIPVRVVGAPFVPNTNPSKR
jgi:hypothetical protein